ncbi:MAG: hypothetical protein ABIA37_00455 [Candidatus Woesearchaeota archaeon]
MINFKLWPKKKADLPDKIQWYISLLLRATLVVAIVLGIFNQRWTLTFSTSLILLLTYLPSMIGKKYKIYLPIEYEFVIVLFIYASLFLGEIRNYYLKFWWWDIILHTSSGIAIGFAGFLILYILYYKRKIETKPIWIALFAFCFALAIGAFWEIIEFSIDSFLGTNMQKSGLVDTMWDLIVDAAGALLTSAIGYFYIRGRKTPLFHRMFVKFMKKNPHYFK